MVLGVIALQKTLRAAQWVSVVISCIAVLMMSLIYGQCPGRSGRGILLGTACFKARVATT